MADPIFVEPAVNDPLLTRVQFGYDGFFYPQGYRARLRSNSALVLDAAKASWSTHPLRDGHHPVEIRLAVSESNSPSCIASPEFRFRGHLLSIVADSENFVSIDLRAGFAFGWATLATARNQQCLRRYFLEPIIESLLRARRTTTSHRSGCIQGT
jgi:hypothetical protein